MKQNPKTTGIDGPFASSRNGNLFLYKPDTEFDPQLIRPDEFAFDALWDENQWAYGDGSMSIGHIAPEVRAAFSEACDPYSYFEEPLKHSGELEHFMPPEFERFLPVLKQIANFEFSHSPWAKYKKANLLLERIIPEEDYPVGHWHQDQPEGVITPCHIYTVSDLFPSIVQIQARDDDFGYDRDIRQPTLNGTQSPVPEGEFDSHFRQLEPYEIVLMSGYNIHRADILPKGTERTLLRVVYEGVPADMSVLPESKRTQIEQARKLGQMQL